MCIRDSLGFQGLDVGPGQRGERTEAATESLGVRAAARGDDEQVAAERADLLADVLLRAKAEADGEDHRRDADQDAQNGQGRSHAVRPDGGPPRAQGLGPGHRWFTSSVWIRPSRSQTMRRACCATSSSWVISTIVRPWPLSSSSLSLIHISEPTRLGM